jgi:O-antigen/teichoic acid export membrane protein
MKSVSVIKGAFIYVMMRWMDRFIGFISTLILARWLVPADFGIIAMISLVIGIAEVLLDLGVNVALIQNRAATQAHYNTAWTLRLLQACGTVIIVSLAAPYAGDYFHDPRVVPVLRIACLGSLLAALENIGTITFQKDLRADLDFLLTFTKRICGFAATVILAWIFHSYWALVFATLFSRSVGLVASYVMHPMRPRLSLEKFGEIFGVSQWMLINSIGAYINLNLHKTLVGRWTNATMMGGYTLADEISSMPSTEILAPLNRILFPTFVRAKNDPAELKRNFLLAQGLQCLIAIPASLGLALVAGPAVQVLLGEKWMMVVPFVQILALTNIVQAISTSTGYVLLSLGRNRNATVTTWTQVVLFASIALLFLNHPQALELAWLRLGCVISGLLVALVILMRAMRNVSLSDMLRNVIRPLLGAAAMACVIRVFEPWAPAAPSLHLILMIVVGALSYVMTVLAAWVVAGRPQGAEAYLLEKIGGVLKRRNAAKLGGVLGS